MLRRLALSILFALTLIASAAVDAASGVKPNDRVVRNVVVRAKPSTASAALAALRPADTAELLAEQADWYKVRLPSGIEGFVSKRWTLVPPLTTALADGTLKLHMIDVGTGLALFVEGPGFTLLYDGGSQDDLAQGASNRVLAYLQLMRPDLARIDHLVLSHPHKDHLELLPAVFDRYVVGHVYDSGAYNPTRGYCRFLRKVVDEPGIQYHDASQAGGTREVSFEGSDCSGTIRIRRSTMMTAAPVLLGGGVRMTTLWRDSAPHDDPNDNSVVVRLDYGMRRILLTGDAEGGGRQAPGVAPGANTIEGKLLACCRAELRADVLVVGHHGSTTSSRTLFLDAVGASHFLISSGPHPYQSVRLPDAAVLTELSRRGAVWRTDVSDQTCGEAPAKVGPDRDESPGGCDNVVVEISAAGTVTAQYNRLSD